jgi:SAM-dependent MidA family methyltransferase
MSWDAKARKWFEWGVTWSGERFAWKKIPCNPSDSRIPKLHESLLAVLPDGYTVDSCNRAEIEWGLNMARALHRGKLLTIDYGLSAEELFTPERVNGTLRAYHQHRLSDDLLAHPGEQDLTAHVNFTAVQAAGESAGLKTEQLCSQAQFLTDILRRAIPTAPGAGNCFADLTAAQVRQFQTLTHPEHFGRAFRVLVQSR